jgi:linoleoyl-CoA desaturase
MQTVKSGDNPSLREEFFDLVDEFFSRHNLSKRDNVWMYIKASLILLAFALSYIGLVFYATTVMMAIEFAAIFIAANIGIGFCIQHDGSHQAFSKRPWVNRIAGMTLELTGKMQFLWHQQHDLSHHTYTNVFGRDWDAAVTPLIRLSEKTPKRWYHKYQHVYVWVLYSFAHLSFLFGDFQKLLTKNDKLAVRRPHGHDLAWLVTSKIAYWGLMFVLPLFFHRWWVVAMVYVLTSIGMGFVYPLVAQPAHMNTEVRHPVDIDWTDKDEWFLHQLATTADFAPGSRLLTELFGGLNLQVVHHLLSRISHTHYPALARILRDLCRKHGVAYHEFPTFFAAIRSHYKYLKLLGQAA